MSHTKQLALQMAARGLPHIYADGLGRKTEHTRGNQITPTTSESTKNLNVNLRNKYARHTGNTLRI